MDGCGESVTDGFGGVPVRETKQHHITGVTFPHVMCGCGW